jgi:hypothetical protein
MGGVKEEFMKFEGLVSIEDGEPVEISIAELLKSDLGRLPLGVVLTIFESEFPESTLWREATELIVEVTEHIYTKYWWHKYHAAVFAEAMKRAVLRLADEGWPLKAADVESDDDVHIFVRWQIYMPIDTDSKTLVDATQTVYDRIWQRANLILENSDSVLILGKDTAEGLDPLKTIEELVQRFGYHTYLVKEQPDRLGESIVQKVMRFALSSKFVLIENSEPSGHLYEIPHVTKMAECVTACLQEKGRGATWMFEDAYAKHAHFKKFEYEPGGLDEAVACAIEWAEGFLKEFGGLQLAVLRWMKTNG